MGTRGIFDWINQLGKSKINTLADAIVSVIDEPNYYQDVAVSEEMRLKIYDDLLTAGATGPVLVAVLTSGTNGLSVLQALNNAGASADEYSIVVAALNGEPGPGPDPAPGPGPDPAPGPGPGPDPDTEPDVLGPFGTYAKYVLYNFQPSTRTFADELQEALDKGYKTLNSTHVDPKDLLTNYAIMDKETNEELSLYILQNTIDSLENTYSDKKTLWAYIEFLWTNEQYTYVEREPNLQNYSDFMNRTEDYNDVLTITSQIKESKEETYKGNTYLLMINNDYEPSNNAKADAIIDATNKTLAKTFVEAAQVSAEVNALLDILISYIGNQGKENTTPSTTDVLNAIKSFAMTSKKFIDVLDEILQLIENNETNSYTLFYAISSFNDRRTGKKLSRKKNVSRGIGEDLVNLLSQGEQQVIGVVDIFKNFTIDNKQTLVDFNETITTLSTAINEANKTFNNVYSIVNEFDESTLQEFLVSFLYDPVISTPLIANIDYIVHDIISSNGNPFKINYTGATASVNTDTFSVTLNDDTTITYTYDSEKKKYVNEEDKDDAVVLSSNDKLSFTIVFNKAHAKASVSRKKIKLEDGDYGLVNIETYEQVGDKISVATQRIFGMEFNILSYLNAEYAFSKESQNYTDTNFNLTIYDDGQVAGPFVAVLNDKQYALYKYSVNSQLPLGTYTLKGFYGDETSVKLTSIGEDVFSHYIKVIDQNDVEKYYSFDSTFYNREYYVFEGNNTFSFIMFVINDDDKYIWTHKYKGNTYTGIVEV